MFISTAPADFIGNICYGRPEYWNVIAVDVNAMAAGRYRFTMVLMQFYDENLNESS
jgi:hypothetical protein